MATLLSRLDRGQDLSWLAERPNIQGLLADALRVPVDDLRRAVGEPAPAQDEVRIRRLRDLPTARALDLSSEALPPGIPSEVLGGSSRPVWWVAPSGSGRSLVGQWLQARGRAKFLELGEPGTELPTELLGKLAMSDALFIELTGHSQGLEAQRVIAPRPGLCVAAPFEPPASSEFQVVESPALAGILPELLEWVADRLPLQSQFDAERLLPSLKELVESRQLPSLGAVLGYVGLVDEFGIKELNHRSLSRLAKRFVEHRVSRRVDPALPYASWVRRSIHAALLGIAERVLSESDVPLETPRSLDDWLALVP
ncbi:MAG TPA: hypothetical protein VFQ61_33515, partial [Polyangiaceae bacterium]|nr:hypothetical protein [Polyangiaceae bacterium]